jgi:hypothetical protein
MQAIPDGCRTEADFRRHYIANRKRLYARAVREEPDTFAKVQRAQHAGYAILYVSPIGPVSPRIFLEERGGRFIYGIPVGPRDIMAIGTKPSRKVKAKEILHRVASRHNLSVDTLLGHRRQKHIVRARHEAMFLIAEETQLSLPQIGMICGKRDHTTVLHALRKWRRDHPPAQTDAGVSYAA